MSEQLRCDSCDRRLFPKEDKLVVWEMKVANAYQPKEPKEYRFDLCEGCSLTIGRALKIGRAHV